MSDAVLGAKNRMEKIFYGFYVLVRGRQINNTILDSNELHKERAGQS